MKRYLIAFLAAVITTSGLMASPANAFINWNTCSEIGFWYANWPGSDNPNLIAEDSTVFGSDTSSADCQRLVGHSDAKMHQSDASSRDTFRFLITGRVLPTDAICTVSAYLNESLWVYGTATNTNSAEKLFKITLNSGQQQLFKNMTHLGSNELKVISDCADYPIANKTLSAVIFILEDSIQDSGTTPFDAVSINSGSMYANSNSVKLDLSFASKTLAQVMISNDGGFSLSNRVILDYRTNTVDWVLNRSSSERLPKTVYVKYRYFDQSTGELQTAWSNTVSDDIILDTISPVINSASAANQTVSLRELTSIRSMAKLDSVKVNLSATDNRSGISKVQYSTTKSASGAVTRTYSKTFNVSLNPTKSTIYLRVQDKAGNWSVWSAVAITKKYSNCAALNKDYSGGVAKSSKVKNKGGKTKYTPKVSSTLYAANKTNDRDGDGITCER